MKADRNRTIDITVEEVKEYFDRENIPYNKIDASLK